ncbi:MAG: HAMP domain-containing protein [Nitrospirae bacterium]|nr:HAMP domain-containing protein [Nitrospirota bacterium]
MSLEKKIILSFIISATIIAIFAASTYINFIEIRKEIRYLEFADTVRSKSLQLRRHEKNFLLYADTKEIEEVHRYLQELNETLQHGRTNYKTESLLNLENKINEYAKRFYRVEGVFWDFQKEFAKLKPSYPKYSAFFPLIESTFLERPLVNADLIEKIFLLKAGNPAVVNLRELNSEISSLRKNGEEMLTLSKDLDKSAREKAEEVIRISQMAVLVLFPLFLVFGLAALFVISHSMVKRLKILTAAIEKTGKGDFSSLPNPEKHDEVGVLITTFNKMEQDLIARDEELSKKNEELLQSRKLASLGTLASGVAHELNNPLNNIYLAAQVLSKEIGHESCPPMVKETVGDIFSQTLRVKRIVSDLLEFARERTPEFKTIKIVNLIREVLNQMAASGEKGDIKFNIKGSEDIELSGDRHLLQQVFVNLFTNAIDAMEGKGSLGIEIGTEDTGINIKVSDSGQGIPAENISRVFDPFFTTKEKGTGLGLAIVYSIIKKHNGKIDVKSKPYKGTTFTITLPR